MNRTPRPRRVSDRQRVRELRAALRALLEWSDRVGAWDAPCWPNAKRALRGRKPLRRTSP